jgi:hypothetical protein
MRYSSRFSGLLSVRGRVGGALRTGWWLSNVDSSAPSPRVSSGTSRAASLVRDRSG